jgi:hypothetical protein
MYIVYLVTSIICSVKAKAPPAVAGVRKHGKIIQAPKKKVGTTEQDEQRQFL